MDAYQPKKDVHRDVIAAVSHGNAAALDALMARGLVDHNLVDHNALPNQAPGLEGFKQWMSAVRHS